MNNFKKLETIKNNFQDNIENSPMFDGTKGILSNFGDFINKHKSMLYGLVGASVMNFAINSMQPVMAEPAPVEMTQAYKSDYSQIDLAKEVSEFNKNVEMGNKVHQLKSLHTSAVTLTSETITNISNLKEGETLQVINPFWENTVLEVKNTTGSTFGLGNDQSGSYLEYIDRGIEHQVTHDNAGLLVDISNHGLYLDFNELNNFLDITAEATDPDYRMDLTKFMIYHEAAHASARQSYNINPNEARAIDISGSELHSDVAALTLIGVETKSLDRFNAVTDMMIKTRIYTSISDSNHNTTYGLIELKKAINENPELLNMKQSDISEFAYMVTKKMIEKDFNNDHQMIALKGNISTNKEDILNDIKLGNNSDAINYYAGKTLNKGVDGFNIENYKANNPERRLTSLANRIEQEVTKHANHADVASVTYMNNAKKSDNLLDNIDATISQLTYNANSNPILNAKTLSVIKAKVQSDELQYDYSKIIEIAKELKETNHSSELSQKIGLKSNKLSS